jgi:S-adenosylmethionine:tRNA ribosyltransferase-isomerase
MNHKDGTQLSDYDYNLPESFIAQFPTEPRDHCKMLVVHRNSGVLEHRLFFEIQQFLRPGDLLVINETQVFPARLIGQKATGGKIEVFLLEPLENDTWKALVKPGRRFRRGSVAHFGGRQLTVTVVEELDEGIRKIKVAPGGETFFTLLNQIGHIPLPPYIRREDTPQDRADYQTVYAQQTGSVAAPTAGLHFTRELLQQITDAGISIVPVTLHIGLDTFRPVSVENILDHHMHTEFYRISETSAEKINATRRQGGRVVAVGTTSVRTLETAGNSAGDVRAGSGWSDLFIYPGYPWQVVDGIITNFHLPKSSLMMMIAAFTGLPQLKDAYATAMSQNYRFFSYGDAMLIL